MRIRSLFVLLALLPGSAFASDFTAWQVPWEKTRPRDPAVDAHGRVWFVGQGGDYVGRLDPKTGEFKRRDLPAGAGPHNLIVGNNGELWIAGNRVGWIGRMDPDSGELKTFPTDEEGVDDPHTLIQANDGRIWFTAQHSNRAGTFNPADGTLRVWEAQTPRASLRNRAG